MPAHLLEYDHRYDEYASSIQNPGRVIAVDLPSKLQLGSGSITENEAEHLRMVVLGLNEKLKGMQILTHENQNMRLELEKHKKSRAELEISIEETTNQLAKQNERQTRTQE